MKKIRTISLSRHSRLFSVPDNSREYLFVQTVNHPYLEEPYRAESYAIALLREGRIHLQAGINRFDIDAPSIIALGPSIIRSFSERTDRINMDIVFFKGAFLLERYADQFFLIKYNFFENSDLHAFRLMEPYQARFQKLFELIKITQSAVNYHQAEIIRNYIFALVFEIDAYYKESSSITQTQLSTYPLTGRFRLLLARNYMRERKLKFYSDQLHITSKYLSATIKKQTGKSAGEWIDETIVLEAKVLLQNKTLTVSQISNMLNFADQSVFGKFFRANCGLSPVEYRKSFNLLT